MDTFAMTEIINNNKKIGEGSSIDNEKREAQVALLTLKNNYVRALELKERVWKLDLYLIGLSLLCIIIGVFGGGSIFAFKTLLTTASSSNSSIEKGEKSDKIPDIDLTESSIHIVQSKIIDNVYDMVRKLKEKKKGLGSLENAECFWLFAGCIILFGIAGYDLYYFATGNSNGANGTLMDKTLIFIGFIGLLFCLSVGLVIQSAKRYFISEDNKKWTFYFVCPFVWCFFLIRMNKNKGFELKDVHFSHKEEEMVLYLLHGVTYNEKCHKSSH
ncbi:1109_t:CDS:2 [Dentiscutata erythropus]|uniref:1109_t:CDS:1 n=1 Tax=Dentiscutata erythropus TaxID=1348616 RepID=A0A9N8YMD3_9GLOM|nr:1109_t:CDS:2 [Dentiscutata erythropus]